MKRIAVIGCSGAGKSTFSSKLAGVLGLPLYHLDAYYWKPGWIPSPREEWHAFVEALSSQEEWIIDGNYSSTLDIRLQYADTVIFLDMPMWLCLYGIVKRRIQYHGRTRPDMNEGCPEKLDMEFVRWVLGYKKRSRHATLRRLSCLASEINLIIFKHPYEAERYLHGLENRTPV